MRHIERAGSLAQRIADMCADELDAGADTFATLSAAAFALGRIVGAAYPEDEDPEICTKLFNVILDAARSQRGD